MRAFGVAIVYAVSNLWHFAQHAVTYCERSAHVGFDLIYLIGLSLLSVTGPISCNWVHRREFELNGRYYFYFQITRCSRRLHETCLPIRSIRNTVRVELFMTEVSGSCWRFKNTVNNFQLPPGQAERTVAPISGLKREREVGGDFHDGWEPGGSVSWPARHGE